MTIETLMPLRFHALLYVSDAPTRQEAPNMRSRLTPEQRLLDYLAMASRLGEGLARHFGVGLQLLTNRPDQLQQLIAAQVRRRAGFCMHVQPVGIRFGEDLPASARFHAAAHKIYVFEHLSRQPGYSLQLDLDMVCQRFFDAHVLERAAAGVPLVYDISEQVFPAFGYQRVARDLRMLSGSEMEYRWFGGEFIGGPASFFAELFATLRPMLGAYADGFDRLHHQGDEILVSAALNLLRQRHGASFLCDVAPLNVVRRHWGIPPGYDAKRFDVETGQLSFVHLPAMKAMLVSRCSDARLLSLVRQLDRMPAKYVKRVRPWLARLLPH